jgi:NitT/TauT family transport system substrate-binding protein
MRTKQLKSCVASAGLVAVLALASACGSADSGSGAGKTSSNADTARLTTTVKITLLYTPSIQTSPAFVAQAKGYFKDENLDVKMEPYTGASAAAMPLLATGKADAISTSTSPGFFNGVANSTGVKLVLDGGVPKVGGPLAAFMVRTDGTVKTVADLKGKKIGLVGGIQTLSGFYLSELLKQAKLTVSDITPVDLDFASGIVALDNGAVAAMLQIQPGVQQEISSGKYKILGDMDAVLSKGAGTGVIFGPSLLKDNRQAGIALTRALQRASATDLQGDYLANAAIAKIIADGTGSTVAAVQTLPAPKFDPTLKINPSVYDSLQTFWISVAALTYAKPAAADAVIDQAMFNDAVKSKK